MEGAEQAPLFDIEQRVGGEHVLKEMGTAGDEMGRAYSISLGPFFVRDGQESKT